MEEGRDGKATTENRKRTSGKWVKFLRVRYLFEIIQINLKELRVQQQRKYRVWRGDGLVMPPLELTHRSLMALDLVLQNPIWQKKSISLQGIQPWLMHYNSQRIKFASLVTQIGRGFLERTD